MSRFKRFPKGIDCPVCLEDNLDCRYSYSDPSFILCHTFADARKGEVIGEYICTKEANGHTASFKPYTGNLTQQAKTDWQTRRLLEQQQSHKRLEAEAKARHEKALSAIERHQFYSQILDELTLDQATITDLKRRGFTDQQIQASGFKSIRYGQKLIQHYPVNLPGIGANGNTFIVGDGYLQPITNHQGLIVGLQLRFHNPKQGNKHCWLSSQTNPVHTQEYNELPIVVRIPSQLKSFDIQFVEGTGVKPFLAAERMGMITIGAAGGNFTSSPQTLKATIQAVQSALWHVAKHNQIDLVTSQSKLEGDVVNQWLSERIEASLKNSPNLKQASSAFSRLVISPDAGFALNPHVAQTILRTTEWLEENFKDIPIFIHDWNQFTKLQGDIDELPDLSIVRRLKLSGFLKKYKEVFRELKGFGFRNHRYQQWAKERVKLTTDIVQEEDWLNIPLSVRQDCDILLIRKALGGGKTQGLINFLINLLKNFPESSDLVTLLIGYRNTLLENTIERAIKLGLDSMHVKDARDFSHSSVINFAADNSIKLWGGCADSFYKFNSIISHNPNYFVVHDEVCSVLGHLKGGGTLKGRQQQAIEWVVETIKNSKFALMMDANLSDKEVDFIRELFPDKRIKVLDSIHDVKPRTFYFLETQSHTEDDYSRNPKYLPSQLVDKAKQFDKVLWISDSQTSCECADEILTHYGHKHFRLDGKTSHEELSRLLQKDPKLFITTQQLDSVSLSPSGESGLSIDLFGYFDAVCFDIRGTVGVNTLTQLSARLRDTNVPIYVSCPDFVNITSDPCPYAIKNVGEILNQRIDQLLLQALNSDEDLLNSESIDDIFDAMKQRFRQDKWFLESLKDAKQLKYEHSNLKLTLKTALCQGGHRVIDLAEAHNEEEHAQLKQTKEVVKRREAEKIFNSKDLSWEEAQRLSSQDVNYETKCAIRKAQLKHKLPGIEQTDSWTADFVYTVLLDETQFLDQRWRLLQLQDEELFKAVFKTQKSYNFEHGFAPQDIWKDNGIKIEALELLGVGRLIEAGVFSSQDDWVRKIVDQYYENDEWFNVIGMPRAKQVLNGDGSLKNLQHVKKMADRFLSFFGLETKLKRNNNGNRLHSITTPEALKNYLLDIDRCLDNRAKVAIEEAQRLSLKALVDKAEEGQHQQTEWEHKQVELNKQILENQLTQSHTDYDGHLSPYIYKKPNEKVSVTEVSNISNTEIERWKQPETITEVAQWLNDCEDEETLALLRQCEIPADIFRLAARQLSPDKRETIRQWVTQQNGT